MDPESLLQQNTLQTGAQKDIPRPQSEGGTECACHNMYGGDFRIPPHDPDQYFSKTATISTAVDVQAHTANCITQLNAGRCTVGDLQDCLQDAVQIEFATIPPYLTALYSIKDGYNQEAYSLIRGIVMQEMLHMVQAANLLIAVGGRPRIYGAKITPKYPITGLPGGTLPQLQVSLK